MEAHGPPSDARRKTDSSEPNPGTGVYPGGGAEPEAETAELLAGVRRGDPEAFDRLTRMHAPRLFRLAMRFTGRREDAEDLVQETLVRALPALRRFEGRAKLSTYLVRALGNQWKNRLRSRERSRLVEWFRGRKRSEENDEAEFNPANGGPSALERLEAADRAREVREALVRLEPNRRWVLLLREVEEMSYEEISAVTGTPVGTVRSRLARARDELRQLLGERL